jgi:hypothetical protein
MARLFTTGFECGDLLDFGSVYLLTASGEQVHTGNYAARGGADQYARKYISPSPNNEVYIRYWWRAGNSGDKTLLQVGTSDSNVEIYGGAGYVFKLRRGATIVATGTLVPTGNTWYMLELYAKLDDAAGVLTLKVDGVEDATFSGDTLPGASAAITNVQIYTGEGLAYVDDIAINDASGAADNSWPGDGRVIGIKPNGAGDNTDFTPSAGANYENVDDVPHDSDTTYNHSGTDGHYDLFNLEACGLSDVDILGVNVKGTMRKEVANGDKARLKVKAGATEYDGDDKDILTSYTRINQEWRTNPNTAAAWQTAEIDALQAGYENRAAV